MDSPEADEDQRIRAERLAIRKRAMDLLARREHARAELMAKLEKREHAVQDIDIVLDELAAEGLQSDARYAEAAVANKARRGIGPVRIRAELSRAGVSAPEIDTALVEADIDWNRLADAARCKRFGEALPVDFAIRAKQTRFLQRRGFNADQIAAAFDG